MAARSSEGTAVEKEVIVDPQLPQNDRYLRLLDSLARFYNSEITAHVGYQISVSAIVVGSFMVLVSSIVLRTQDMTVTYGTISLDDMSIRIGVLAVLVLLVLAWSLGRFPLSLRYMLGRTQIYIALSQIVFEHMGLKTKGLEPSEKFRKMLRERALREERGIEGAVRSLFEARLFVSKCYQRRLEDLFNEENLRVFDVDAEETGVIIRYEDYFKSRILGPRRWFAIREIMFLAHGEYSTEKRSTLIRLAFDP